ncbi:MAG: nitroreductase family protein [Bacteroidota bacterium]
MTIEKLINKSRSYRRFYQDYKISEKQLFRLVNLARLSPSPRNLQALKFWISNDEKLNEKIFPSLAWAGYLKDWTEPPPGEQPAAYIFILADKNISDNFQKDFLPTASGIAAQSILLGATEMGLGGCIIAAFQKTKVAETLSLDNNLEILLILALGKPKENVIIQDIDTTGSIIYWRDEKGNHYVPKRKLEDIIKIL